ncbi:hypothetical protein KXD40_007149 [Peronospora effusa]|uniref:UDP-N-acetylglucosamine--dolichyl-phosphate N-acetylglucosaminephosphotransferase n=1 Tax=Peronospora effusa TaxID=542832 RepID=A0A3M6V9R1_9STRA|nr:hypothetical protein DD238_007150 [Peronospora effusa]UIZ29067.1 hypothetical protein KXD40_007149 [Peronospora effusa]
MYSTSSLLVSVASAAVVGSILGLVLGIHCISTCPKESSRYGMLTCLLCRKKKKGFPKRLILMRHGESEGNIDPELYGRVPDNAMHLTELGYEQAIAAGESIKKLVGNETMRFIVSPYVRTIETFCGIRKAWGFQGDAIPWTEEPRIREQDFGNFQEPRKIRECKAQRRRFGSFFYRFPSGESPADVYDRVSSFLESLYRMFVKSSEENYVLVTHGVAIRVILMRYFKYRISDFELLENFRNGEFVVLELDECQGKFMLKTIVSNKVHIHKNGSVSVDTSETTQLRLHLNNSMSSISRPYSTFPINHFRHPPPLLPPIRSNASSPQHENMNYLLHLTGIGVVSYVTVALLIPLIGRRMPAKLSGKDLCKRGTPAGDLPIPEALGIVSGIVYIAALIVTVVIVVDNSDVKRMMVWGIISILSMILLGFTDDLSDLRWRHKLLFPPLASLALLINYAGLTAVVLPKPVRFLFAKDKMLYTMLNPVVPLSDGGAIIELGLFYYLYMGMMAVFCTNAINIYAGVNGLEAGQSFVIGAAVVVQNVWQILLGHDNENFHYLSLMFMVPFLATTLGLLKHNWYPSRVFVGDTFCYYAGMTFAVCGILGHFSKTLLLFFLPQVLNFLYSIPQLFKIVPCPRHRLPKYNAKTGLLEPSTITPESTRSNYTIINLFLVVFGPMKEVHLVLALLAFQVLCCGLAFFIRYGISGYFYDFVQ